MKYKEFLELAKIKHGDKYIYNEQTEQKFNGSHSLIPIICPKHGQFWVEARKHLMYECSKCSYESRMIKFRSNTQDFIEKAKKIHGNKYDYSKVNYIKAKTNITVICPIHGEFQITPNNHLSGNGCSKCNDSHVERNLELSLCEKNIDFERKKHFEWLGRQEIDFYLPQYNIGIECQGKQHIGLGGWTNTFKFHKVYEWDEKKNILCCQNNIKLIYLIEKQFFDKALTFKIYNDENTFYDINQLLTQIL